MLTSERRLALGSVPNARDLGGIGKVKPRRVIRSVDLSRISPIDAQFLRDLGVATSVDLRTAAERDRAGYAVDGITTVHLDVLADDDVASTTSVTAFLSDPESGRQFLLSGRGPEMMRQAYRNLVDLPSARTGYANLVRLIAGTEGGVLVHCTAGKDRTGWAAAVLLSAVGVGVDEIMSDYLQTNDDLLPVLEPLFAKVAADGIDPELLLPVVGVREEYLQTAWNRVSESYGSMYGYLREGLGLDDAEIENLSERLTSS